jgi:hypothetical protein
MVRQAGAMAGNCDVCWLLALYSFRLVPSVVLVPEFRLEAWTTEVYRCHCHDSVSSRITSTPNALSDRYSFITVHLATNLY